MNIPNKLTLSRLMVTPVFVFLLAVNFPGNYFIALILFLLAMLTDYIDGSLARSWGEVTVMGQLLDPLADKILISSAFIMFVGLPDILLPAWLVIIIVSREFAITGIRLLAAGRGIIIPAGRWGKHKTVSQVITVSAVLIYLCLLYDPSFDREYYRQLIIILVGITTAFTFTSGFYYILKNIGVLKEPAKAGEEETTTEHHSL
jgi:CDP-diacylglycerol---glycerol-3-phosphate 3-phosphatidyltransferase